MSDANPLLSNRTMQGAAKAVEGLLDQGKINTEITDEPQKEAVKEEPKKTEAKAEDNSKVQEEENFQDKLFKDWKKRWNERLVINNNSIEKSIALMRTVNPLVIPRNDKVEETLNLANKNNFKMLFEFLEILKTPYEELKNTYKYQIPNENNKEYKTFCGT